MFELALIRHGKTQGNLEKRYIGRTDQPLCPQGMAGLTARRGRYPSAQLVYCSPLLRCLQTAQQIYPDHIIRIESELRETDFGEFEGKNYQELAGHPAYLQFLESGGKLAFPGGEEPQAFQRRCCCAFERIVQESAGSGIEAVSVICHGGTIMAVLEAFCVPKQDFYSYQAANGCGYLLRRAGEGTFRIVQQIG